jgi:hypothetical protein
LQEALLVHRAAVGTVWTSLVLEVGKGKGRGRGEVVADTAVKCATQNIPDFWVPDIVPSDVLQDIT